MFVVAALVAKASKKQSFDPKNAEEIAEHFWFICGVDLVKSFFSILLSAVYAFYGPLYNSDVLTKVRDSLTKKNRTLGVLIGLSIHMTMDIFQAAFMGLVKWISKKEDNPQEMDGEILSAPVVERTPTPVENVISAARFTVWMEKAFYLSIAAPILASLQNENEKSDLNFEEKGWAKPKEALRRLLEYVESLDTMIHRPTEVFQ